jgi:hypothetical protein
MGAFKKGKSGNPTGRPRGVPDRRTELRKLLEPHAEKLVRKAVTLALKGDVGALRLCLERLIPAIKTRDAPVEIGPLFGSLAAQGRTVFAAVAEQRLSPDQAATLMQALAAQARILEVDELEKRVAQLEETRAADGGHPASA